MQKAIAGTARADISPSWPVMQAGFGQRTHACTGVHDPIYAKALFLSTGERRLLMVTTDLVCIPKPLADAVIQQLGQKRGLIADEICICASHTHSAPYPMDPTGELPGIARYAPFLLESLVKVADDAVGAAAPARFKAGVGQVDFFRNRRKRGSPNLVDPRVCVLAVEDEATGQTRAVLFGCGCHPVTRGWDNMEISADFAGYAQKLVEDALPTGNALFFNTTEGNIVPNTNPNRDALDPRGYCGGSYENTIKIGTLLANEVVRVLKAAEVQPDLTLDSCREDLRILPIRSDLDEVGARALFETSRHIVAEFLGADFETAAPIVHLWSVASRKVIEKDMSDDEMRRLMIACCYYRGLEPRLSHPGRLPLSTVPIQVMRLAGFEFLSLPGEVMVEVGLEWKERAGSDRAFIVGLANGTLRYLPHPINFTEPDWDVRYETVTAGLEPSAMGLALQEGSRLLQALRSPAGT